jgi:ADP-ribosyl-[dinitrogen reductase] hydrolase
LSFVNEDQEAGMDAVVRNRIRGCAVGAAVGDALGMPLEFRPRQRADRLVREMRAGRVPSGSFTDDTEMALAVAESLLAHCPLDPADLARRFVAWYRTGPADVGIQCGRVLERIAGGQDWQAAVKAVQRQTPDAAGNGSIMRCWPVALAHWNDEEGLLVDSRLQSRVTHPHADCESGCAFVNATVYYLLHGARPTEAVAHAVQVMGVGMTDELRRVIETASSRSRQNLKNSGWVRHTVESAVWGLLTTSSFEEAVVQVVNLGDDTDTAGAVVGAMAGAAYGLGAIPERWREALRGEWLPRSGRLWRAADLIDLADQLGACSLGPAEE